MMGMVVGVHSVANCWSEMRTAGYLTIVPSPRSSSLLLLQLRLTGSVPVQTSILHPAHLPHQARGNSFQNKYYKWILYICYFLLMLLLKVKIIKFYYRHIMREHSTPPSTILCYLHSWILPKWAVLIDLKLLLLVICSNNKDCPEYLLVFYCKYNFIVRPVNDHALVELTLTLLTQPLTIFYTDPPIASYFSSVNQILHSYIQH